MDDVKVCANGQFLLLDKDDMMLLAQTQEQIMKNTRKKYLDMHPFNITKRKDGYYQTYIPDESRKDKRRLVKKRYRKDVENAVIAYYKDKLCLSFEDMFREFVDRKVERGDIKKSTKTRYEQVFKRHYVETGWHKKKMENVSPEQLSDFIEDEVGRCNLSSKGLTALAGITKGMIQRARKNKAVSYHVTDVFGDIDVKTRKVHRRPERETFTETELPMLVKYLMENHDVHNLSILFMLLSGLRVGEMVGLKFSDFTSKTSAVIQRSETRWRDEHGIWRYEIDTPKTEAGYRTIYIPQEYDWIYDDLRRMNPYAEYVCTFRGKRMHTVAVRDRLYRICDKLGLEKKSTHKLRKTFCSILLDGGFDQNLIISLMGHTDIGTSERFYHFDRKSAEKKQKMMDNIVEFRYLTTICPNGSQNPGTQMA